MRILKVSFAALFALHLGASAVSAAPVAQTGVRAQRQLTSKNLRRPFNPTNKTALPASWNIAGQTYVSHQEYLDLRNGVMELLRRYPPDKYFFVGLGRDPAPVIAFLQNLGEKNIAVNLPGTSNINWASNAALQPSDVARHIEAAIPKEILKGERQIVVLDVTSTGKTPAVFGPFMDRYLQGIGNNTPSVKLAFSWNNVKANNYGPQLSDWINTSQWADYSRYFSGKYEGSWNPQSGGPGIAEHQRHQMGPGVQPPTQTSPNYAAFRQAVLARMEQDAELDKFLSEQVGISSQFDDPKAMKAAMAKERAEQAKLALELRAFPKKMAESSTKLVTELAERSDPHTKGPYLSENGEKLNAWLMESLEVREKAEKTSSSIRKQGINMVTSYFIEHTLEKAMKADKIRNRDYRRLLGHALGASVMDKPMLEGLAALYKKSPDMRRELTEESEFYLEGSKHQPAGTEKMGENYKKLMAVVAPQLTFNN